MSKLLQFSSVNVDKCSTPELRIVSVGSKTISSDKNEFYINQWEGEQHKIFMQGFYEKNISTKGAYSFDISEGLEGNVVRAFPYSECGELMETFQTKFGGFKMNPHVIAMQVLINSVSNLDPVRGSFWTQGSIDFRWYEPKFENRMVYEPGTWIPRSDVPSAQGIYDRLFSPNAIEWEKTPSEVVSVQQFEHWPVGCAKLRVNFQGTFMENFELNQFPFDVQDLTLKFKLDLLPGNYRFGSICIPDYQYTQKVSSRSIQVWKYGIRDIVFSEWAVYEPQVLFGNGS